jgi:hypothetical protein
MPGRTISDVKWYIAWKAIIDFTREVQNVVVMNL